MALLSVIDVAAREMTLFASVFFLIGGVDDLLVDLLYALRWFRHRLRGAGGQIEAAAPDAAMVVFVAAWDEGRVIGQMLRASLARFDYPDYRLYVGTYPNDLATIAAVAQVAGEDSRVRLVIGGRAGPTTKADCLNTLWRALLRDEAVEGHAPLGVAIHDAEDLVHPLELRVQAEWLTRHAAVQLPVLPLPHPRSPLVAGHYCDEFAEAHAKVLPVRGGLGAGMPLAGVGCAIRRDMLAQVAQRRGGDPFDETSLTEDYELGLTLGMLGGSVALARVAEAPGGAPVAVRAYFPATVGAAVRQKARWFVGIALAGWDRTGWNRPWRLTDHWMRMRDRRITLAMPVLAIAYAALLAWGASLAGHALAGSRAPALSPVLEALLLANALLLVWRVLVRAAFARHAYGWRQALLSAPRMLVGNYIALLAARRAAFRYAGMLLGAAPRWDKTAHEFPDTPEQRPA